MITLTTRERDILRIILNADRPIGSAELATRLHLTPRQVNYSMRGVRGWLKQHNQELKASPRVGFMAQVTPEQLQVLAREINRQAEVQIVLSVSQRQQMLGLYLLSKPEPVILTHLEQLAGVSRMTLVKDLDELEGWLNTEALRLIRKPHFGILAEGNEQDVRRALAKLLWGETPWGQNPLAEITHHSGLSFTLQGDARLSPLVEKISALFGKINLRRAINLVAQAETQLGLRFTDEAVLHLALMFALQAHRIEARRWLVTPPENLAWLPASRLWPVAEQLSRNLGRASTTAWKLVEITSVACELLAAPRNEAWSGEPDYVYEFAALEARLLGYLHQALEASQLKHDGTLQNDLLSNIIPAYFRQSFKLWFPATLNLARLPEACEREMAVAQKIAAVVEADAGWRLPANEINNLVVLLRAAHIRNRPYRVERVLVVCPSGMATAQLLTARLKVRFPFLNMLEVVSLRDLTPALAAGADLILTTVALPKPFAQHPKVVVVHPLLMPQDVEAITQVLS